MITLYGFGPGFDLPDPSPFVTKAHILLQLAGLKYATDVKGFRKAPKGKLPYINDDGAIVADTTFIRFHIEKKYGFDFDRGLNPLQKGAAWAVERMCEEHLYWLMVDARWLDDANFEAGPSRFFNPVPAPVRPLVKTYIRRSFRKTLYLNGLGRHEKVARVKLGCGDLAAISDMLGDKPFLFGDEPRGADATAGAFVMGVLSKTFVTPLRDAAASTPNLHAYGERISKRFFPNSKA